MVKAGSVAVPSIAVIKFSAEVDTVGVDCGTKEMEAVGVGLGASARSSVGPSLIGTSVGTSVTPSFTGTYADGSGVAEGVGDINVGTTVRVDVDVQAAKRTREASSANLIPIPIVTLP